MIGSDVYEAKEAARRRGREVKTLLLGDSVARQLFRPGTEQRPEVRYATSNYAIAVAGQYYLLEDALKRLPNVREVDVLLVAGVWRNDLGPPFTDDYVCGHFHSAAQVAEVWRLKKDLRLTAVHASRWLMPNLMAENTMRRPQGPPDPPPRATPERTWLTPAAGEPVVRLADSLLRNPPRQQFNFAYAPDGGIIIPISRTSRHYLAKMRDLCHRKGVRLRVLPGPLADIGHPYLDDKGIYEGEFIYMDIAKTADATHVLPPYVDEVRARVIATHGLEGLAGPPPTSAPAP